MPTTTKPTVRAVETLAEWVHKQFLTTTRSLGAQPWAKLTETSKRNYCRVARRLLERPPDVLCEAVRRLGDVTGREPCS